MGENDRSDGGEGLPAVPAPDRADATANVAGRLKELLQKVLAESEDRQMDVPLHADLVELGVNSVDYLQFVLAVETAFGLEIPDDVVTDPALLTLDGWVNYLRRDAKEAFDKMSVAAADQRAATPP